MTCYKVTTMNYKIEGKGETLVFIHGLSDSLEYWEYLATNLKYKYRILRMDLRGHGKTDLQNDKITVDIYVNDLKILLDELNIQKVNLVGFSLGGLIALDFALKYPSRVSGMVLMSSFAKPDKHLTKVFKKLQKALERGFDEFYDTILPMVLCPDVIADNLDELEIIKKSASKTANTRAYIQAIDACLEFDVEDKLSQIDVPVLVMAARHDDLCPFITQKSYQSKIENSRLIVFEDVKHNILVGKNNMRVLELLEEFF